MWFSGCDYVLQEHRSIQASLSETVHAPLLGGAYPAPYCLLESQALYSLHAVLSHCVPCHAVSRCARFGTGELSSDDDFYLLDTGMVVLQVRLAWPCCPTAGPDLNTARGPWGFLTGPLVPHLSWWCCSGGKGWCVGCYCCWCPCAPVLGVCTFSSPSAVVLHQATAQPQYCYNTSAAAYYCLPADDKLGIQHLTV